MVTSGAENDNLALLIALMCRMGERVTLTYDEVEDIRRGAYGIQWTRDGDSFQNDTFTIEVIGGP